MGASETIEEEDAFWDADRIVWEYGGNSVDWVKKSSSSYAAHVGTVFETHWTENLRTGQRVEFKSKFPVSTVREDEYGLRKRAEMVEIARLMLAGQFDLIEGCRRVVFLSSLAGLQDDPTVVPFRGFESEPDHLPRGDARKSYAADYLQRLDREAKEYLDAATTETLRALVAIC